MAYELQGTIKLIDEMQTFASGFTKREFVVTTADKFPQDIKFGCIKEKTSLLDNLKVGEQVNVFFDIRGNEYKGRYYVDLSAWKIEPLGSISDVKNALGGDDSPPEPPGGYFDEGSDDSVPF